MKTQIPALNPISPIHFHEVKTRLIQDNFKINGITSKQSKAVKIEWIFEAGRIFESKKLVSEITSKMLLEGTLNKKRETFLEEIEYHGASIKTYSNYEKSGIIMYCLSDKCNILLHLVEEMLKQPAFDEDNLKKLCEIRAKNYEHKIEDSDFLAHQYSFASMFGENNAYGYIAKPEDYFNINIDEIKSHFNLYKNGVNVIACGDFDNSTFDTIETLFTPFINSKMKIADEKNMQFETQNFLIDKSQQQASIRISKSTLPKQHEDYAALSLLNTILGGYFGSRLMKSLRENKGYTYGAYSQIGSFSQFGYWTISTQTSHKNAEKTILLIREILIDLQENIVSEDELQMAKNYFLGSIIAECDGAFKSSDVLREMITQDLDFSWVNTFGQKIASITAFEIQALAKEHLNYSSFNEVLIL